MWRLDFILPRPPLATLMWSVHLKVVHDNMAYHHAETDRLVFRSQRLAGQAQPQGVRLVEGVSHPDPCLPLVLSRRLPPRRRLCGKLRLGCKRRLPWNRDR